MIADYQDASRARTHPIFAAPIQSISLFRTVSQTEFIPFGCDLALNLLSKRRRDYARGRGA
jgi:hypothetical protein